MQLQHQLPSKVYYLDRLGNMSTSSSVGSVGSTSSAGSGAVRKQILPLKPKQPNNYVQHLEMKGKLQEPPSVPVTMLELKKKEKSDKNVVTQLTYRKPSTVSSSGSGSSDHSDSHRHVKLTNAPKRPGSLSSSGYGTDSIVDQENCDVFSNILGNTFGYHEMDMLHSHPIWSPQAVDTNSLNNNVLSAVNHNHHHHHHHHHLHVFGFNEDKFLVQ